MNEWHEMDIDDPMRQVLFDRAKKSMAEYHDSELGNCLWKKYASNGWPTAPEDIRKLLVKVWWDGKED